jgi:RHS repeat-associated protein
LTNVTVKDSSQNVIQESDYTYDAFNQRIGVEVDPDGDGQESATQRWTAYDGANPYADFDGSGNLTNRYLYGPAADMILARMDSSGDVAWYLTDHLGSVRDLADPGGNVIDHITYDSFGSVLSESVPAEGDRFKFTGRELDSETGLYYYRARYYDPAMGRFLSEDPIGFQGGDANIYRYVGNGPTAACDPTGLAASGAIPGFVDSGAIAGADVGAAPQGGGWLDSIWDGVSGIGSDIYTMVTNPGATAGGFFSGIADSFTDGSAFDSAQGAVVGIVDFPIYVISHGQVTITDYIGPLYGNSGAYDDGWYVGAGTLIAELIAMGAWRCFSGGGVAQQERIARLLSQAEEANRLGFEAARAGDFGAAREYLAHATELAELAAELLGL